MARTYQRRRNKAAGRRRLWWGGGLTVAFALAGIAGCYLWLDPFKLDEPADVVFAWRSSEGPRLIPGADEHSQRDPVLVERLRYPYSVVPGGVSDGGELRAAAGRDSVVARHYQDFDLGRAMVVELGETKLAYVSYRIKDEVFWTQKKLALQKGERLLTDGVSLVRTRCGNRVSDTPKAQASLLEPPEEVLNTPEVPYAPAIEKGRVGELASPLGLEPALEKVLEAALPQPSEPSPVGILGPPPGWGGGGWLPIVTPVPPGTTPSPGFPPGESTEPPGPTPAPPEPGPGTNPPTPTPSPQEPSPGPGPEPGTPPGPGPDVNPPPPTPPPQEPGPVPGPGPGPGPGTPQVPGILYPPDFGPGPGPVPGHGPGTSEIPSDGNFEPVPEPAPVPEPSTYLLMGAGLGLFWVLARRRSRASE